MAIMRVSRQARAVAVALVVASLPACANTAAQEEIRRLEARSAYESGVKSIAENRISVGLASLSDLKKAMIKAAGACAEAASPS